jgi:hypothetical protein
VSGLKGLFEYNSVRPKRSLSFPLYVMLSLAKLHKRFILTARLRIQ